MLIWWWYLNSLQDFTWSLAHLTCCKASQRVESAWGLCCCAHSRKDDTPSSLARIKAAGRVTLHSRLQEHHIARVHLTSMLLCFPDILSGEGPTTIPTSGAHAFCSSVQVCLGLWAGRILNQKDQGGRHQQLILSCDEPMNRQGQLRNRW